MQRRVPVLFRAGDSFVHRLDPRLKVSLLFLLFVYLFVAPSWPWMLAPLALGLAAAINARTPWQWLLFFWAIHLPSFIVITGLPMYEAGAFEFNEGVGDAMRLVLAWSAAIVVSVSLMSTVEPDDLVTGLRGLGLPVMVGQAVGLSYRLLYVTLHETLDMAGAMKLKGVELEPRRPARLLRNCLKLSLPVLFTVLRRAPVLMCALEMRGFEHMRGQARFRIADTTVLITGIGLVALATWERFGPLELLPLSIGAL